MNDINVERVIPRDQEPELLAHARPLAKVCADCGCQLDGTSDPRASDPHLCGLCYSNRLVRRRE